MGAEPRIEIAGLTGMPEIRAGDDLAAIVAAAIERLGAGLEPHDIVVVTQKIVSKAEGRAVRLDEVEPSGLARDWGSRHRRDPRLVEVILREARRIVRMDRGLVIAETRHGFVCANAGVDSSNTEPGTVLLLPEDPDRSARVIREGLRRRLGTAPAVIVSDSFGRPWREGIVNVAIGVAGCRPLADYRGERDPVGHVLQTTVMATADEAASAAELVMGKTARVPAALIRGCAIRQGDGSARELIRPSDLDLFR
jgi:coenzyme F420-0:L-glutamate ligase/coenzyme F420-1:gamma-L-glutamate ligase